MKHFYKKKKLDKSDGLAFNYIESGFAADGKSNKWVRAESNRSNNSKLLSSTSYATALDAQYFDARPVESKIEYLKPLVN